MAKPASIDFDELAHLELSDEDTDLPTRDHSSCLKTGSGGRMRMKLTVNSHWLTYEGKRKRNPAEENDGPRDRLAQLQGCADTIDVGLCSKGRSRGRRVGHAITFRSIASPLCTTCQTFSGQ